MSPVLTTKLKAVGEKHSMDIFMIAINNHVKRQNKRSHTLKNKLSNGIQD
jgi:hypothetical protein